MTDPTSAAYKDDRWIASICPDHHADGSESCRAVWNAEHPNDQISDDEAAAAIADIDAEFEGGEKVEITSGRPTLIIEEDPQP